MPIQRIKDLNNMSSEERTKKLGELRAELSRLRTMVSAGGAVENPTRMHELRKAIAQVLTVENEQKLKQAQTPAKETKKTQKTPKTKEKKTK
jgi:large subunit ribosomal protein L29